MGDALGVRGTEGDDGEPSSHHRCPFCSAGPVSRLWLGSALRDSCECTSCSARWEESADGAVRGRDTSFDRWGALEIRW